MRKQCVPGLSSGGGGEGAGDEATVRAELATTNLESSKLDFQVVSEPGPIRPIPGYATGLRYIDLT